MNTSIVRTKAALGIYLVIGLADIAMGTRFFLSNQFMPYHSQALGASWPDVDLGVQTLILALMKLAGGGWLALGFFTIVLVVVAIKTVSVGVRWALPIGTTIFYLASFAATWTVYQETGAATPWGLSLAMVTIALCALFLDAPWSSRDRSNHTGDGN